VSPRYAREITTPEFGCGLDGLLRKRQTSLTGILNGVDYEEWNTTHNPMLPHPYSARNLAGKELDKVALQKELGLPTDAGVPLFGSITRLADQKGLDIQLGALEEMLSSGIQFALLGSGSPIYEKAYQTLARRHPGKVAIRIGFNQGYSLRYGTSPIVRVTGGLDDSVIDISEDADKGNGIKFTAYTARALA